MTLHHDVYTRLKRHIPVLFRRGDFVSVCSRVYKLCYAICYMRHGIRGWVLLLQTQSVLQIVLYQCGGRHNNSGCRVVVSALGCTAGGVAAGSAAAGMMSAAGNVAAG